MSPFKLALGNRYQVNSTVLKERPVLLKILSSLSLREVTEEDISNQLSKAKLTLASGISDPIGLAQRIINPEEPMNMDQALGLLWHYVNLFKKAHEGSLDGIPGDCIKDFTLFQSTISLSKD